MKVVAIAILAVVVGLGVYGAHVAVQQFEHAVTVSAAKADA